MSIFASKTAFAELDLEAVAPSTAHMYQDCYICRDPLDLNIHTTASEKHHVAVRIGVCGHMHGQVCLAAWLDAGNSCPTCKRLLFEGSGRGVSQSDIKNVVRSLGHLFGAKRVVAAILRIVGKQEGERAQLPRAFEEEQKKIEAGEVQAPDFIDDDYWMDSGEEDEDFEMEDDEDGGIELDEQVGPQSAKA